MNAINFRLTGVATTGSQAWDSVFVKLPLDAVQTLLDVKSVENMVILLKDTDNTQNVASKLKKLFKEKNLPLEIKTWDQLATFYHKVVTLFGGIFNVVRMIIIIVVFFSIANTMTMSVFERVTEIGTIRAIGTKKSGIIKLFITEGIVVGVIGGLLGVVFGILAAEIINLAGGIPMPPPPGRSVGFVSQILIVPSILLFSVITMIITAVISSIYPAYKATKLNVVEALRHV